MPRKPARKPLPSTPEACPPSAFRRDSSSKEKAESDKRNFKRAWRNKIKSSPPSPRLPPFRSAPRHAPPRAAPGGGGGGGGGRGGRGGLTFRINRSPDHWSRFFITRDGFRCVK